MEATFNPDACPGCADQIVPAAVSNRINRAMQAIEQASTSPSAKAKRVLKGAISLLKGASRAAGRAATSEKLTSTCAHAIQQAIQSTVDGVRRELRTKKRDSR